MYPLRLGPLSPISCTVQVYFAPLIDEHRRTERRREDVVFYGDRSELDQLVLRQGATAWRDPPPYPIR